MMNSSQVDTEPQTPNEGKGVNATAINPAEGVKELEQSGSKSKTSLQLELSKSISVLRESIYDLTEVNEEDEADEESVRYKSTDATNTKKRAKTDRTQIIEVLNLHTKPRFQAMKVDLFRTFLTRKSKALEEENVDLKVESSLALELRYPMLRYPVVPQKSPSPSKSEGTRRSPSIPPTKGISRTVDVPQQQVDSTKMIVENNFIADRSPSPDSVASANRTSDEEIDVIRKSKHLKREGKVGKTTSDSSGNDQAVSTKKVKKLRKSISRGSASMSRGKKNFSDDKIEEKKKRTAHKDTLSKKSKNESVKEDIPDIPPAKNGENKTEKFLRTSVIDTILDNPDWADVVTVGDLVRDADSNLLMKLVSEDPDEEMEVTGGELKYNVDAKDSAHAQVSSLHEVNQHFLPRAQQVGKEPSKGTSTDHSFGSNMSVTSFLTRSKDRVFKNFIRNESVTIGEAPSNEPRRSYFDYPSMMIAVDPEGWKLNLADNTRASQMIKGVKLDSSSELLPAVSATTARLVSMYEADVELKEHGRWCDEDSSPPPTHKDITAEPVDRRTQTHLEAFSELLGTLQNTMDAREKIEGCQCKFKPCSIERNIDDKHVMFLPDQFTDDDFMKYFCNDWAQPEKPVTPAEEIKQKNYSFHKPRLDEGESDLEEDGRSRFSDILEKIEDNEIYDIIFTYRLPKTAPFDLKDTVNEARFKSIFKWLEETGNKMYRSVFEEEVKAKAEEKINDLLMEKMVSLQRKIKRCDICNKAPSAPSVISDATSISTFSMQEPISEPISITEADAQTHMVGKEVSAETHASDLEIECEMGVLMRKLNQSIVSYEDADFSEKSQPEINVTAEKDENDNADQRSTSSHAEIETRGAKRRREIREQLEKLIILYEKKLKKMKTRHIVANEGEDDKGEVISIERELSFKSCHCQDDVVEDQDPKQPDNELDDILENFPVNSTSFLTKRLVCQRPDSKSVTEEQPVFKFTKRNHIQLYLLNQLDTWEDNKTSSDKIEEMRLIDIMEDRKNYEKERLHSLATEHPALNLISNDDPSENKEPPEQNTTSLEVPTHTEIPFTCSCFCDRVSRFSPKRNQHFRTVLNEHFWCLRTEARLLEDESYWDRKSSEHQTPTQWSLCPPQAVEQPDNFQGWLTDTDRNLLLLMSRPPLNRIDKDYYKKTTAEKKVQPPVEEVESEQISKEKQLLELVNQLSKAQAAKFWETVDRWYEDYKKRDKVRQMLELFQDVDLNALLQRDLTLMKEELAKQLEITKEEVRIEVEREKREKFEDDVKKLRGAYSCNLKNRLSAKRKEMEGKKEFLVRCMLVEAKENFAPVIEKYKKKCIEWIENLRDKQNETSLLVKQRNARELALIADKCDVAERVRRKVLGTTGKEHEEVEKIIGKAIESRDIMIEGLKSDVVNLTRDVNIWNRAVGEVLKSFKKFVRYVLETRPDRAQYVLSLEKLYQLQMDDLIRDANNELERVETNEIKPTARPSETLQPTMEIKCPSHDIRYPTEHSEKTGSSSDTDIEQDIRARKVVDHAVDAAIRAALPTPELSVEAEGEGEDDLQELEKLMSLFEDDHSGELKIESVSSEEVCEEEQRERERIVRVIGEGASDPCISVEEFTKRRIREMLEIISSKKHLIRNHVHL